MVNQITIEIDAKMLPLLNGYSLCVAKVLADATGEVSDVIMATDAEIASSMTVTWTNSYQMNATTQEFQEGSVVISGGSPPLPIDLGESYTLQSFTDTPNVAPDPDALTNGFDLVNGMICSAVISIQYPADGPYVPIYISPSLLIAGRDQLIPENKIVLWFKQDATSASMISKDKGNSVTVDCTDAKPHIVSYVYPGVWTPQKRKKPPSHNE